MGTPKGTLGSPCWALGIRNWIIVFLSFHYLSQIEGSSIRLNVPRVRLPYFDTLSVNFRLHVDTPGCYKWTASRADIIKLTAPDGKNFDLDENECYDSAVVSTFPRASITFPASATVFAEDVNTKESVRCDVIIDRIEEIKIVTTNSYVHLEEAPSKFHVRGYGSHGNEFSTMEGVPIRWWLETPSDASTEARSIVRFLPFSESLYEAKPAIAALEAKRLQGSEVLVEGLKPGSVIVNAKIQSPFYKHVPKHEVKIVAVAHLILEPTDVYIVPETTVSLKLIQMKQGRLFEIRLPSDTYVFEVENTTVASYDPQTSTVTGLLYGETKITVQDKNNLEDDLTDVLSAYIYVREPKFLGLTIRPYQNWALMIGQEYTITVEIFDADSQKMFIGNNIFIKTTFDPSFFTTEYSSTNGTFHIGKPIRTGTAKVTAELRYYVRKDGTRISPPSKLKVKGEMEIFQRVALNPKLTVLPWDPQESPKHEINFKASGGNGMFVWNSTNSSVVSVNQNGNSKTHSYGMANVTAAMTINANIKGTAQVFVLLPTSMKIVDHIVEAEIGAPILVPLAFYTVLPGAATETPVSFSTCRHLNFKVSIEDPSFVFDSVTYYPHAKPACAYLPIIGKQLGSTLVTVTYSTAGVVFTDSVTVSTFKPLKVVEPISTTTVLAVGSSRQLVFEGGPRPLLERVADFTRKIMVGNSTVAKVAELEHRQIKDDLYIYEVVCHEVGQTLVTLEIGNSRETKDRIPVRRTGDVQVICGEPSKIYFKIETIVKPEDFASKCPHDISSAQIVRIPVPNYDNILVSVTVKDDRGNKFDNITSLSIHWSTSLDIVSFLHKKYVPTETIYVNEYTVPGKSYQTIMPIGKSGNIEVTAEVVGYRPEVLRFYSIRPNVRLSIIDPAKEYLYQRSLSMDLQLVSDVSLQPHSATLFNHPSSKVTVRIIEGSGYFEVFTAPSSILETKYFENNKTVQVKPMREGEAKLVVKDLCLTGRPTAETIIRVNGVGTIVIDVEDKIQVSSSTTLTVQLFDKNGNPLTAKDLALIDLKPISVTYDNIDVEPLQSSSKIQYKVTGKNVGEATIGFVAEGPSRSSRSEIKRILVFPPLAVFPKHLTLLVGSVYQAVAQGGPQPDSLTEFTSEVKSHVAVTNNGIIQGRALGTSKVYAKAIDQTSSIVYSEDSLEVSVVNLVGLRIHTALSKIEVNQIMPVWAVGLSQNGVELDPTALFGGKRSLMTFEWSLGNTGIAEIKYPFEKYGMLPARDQPYFRFHAKQPGLVSIRLIGNMTGKVFVAEAVVEIIDEFRVINLPLTYAPLLMSPNSEINLKTNKDSSATVSYKIQSFVDEEVSSWNGNSDIVSIDSVGTLRSRDKIGDAIVRISYLDNNSGITKSIGYIVSVRLIAYHMLSPLLPIKAVEKRRQLDTIPRGIPFQLAVSYHDNFGLPFHVTNVSPKIRPNRFGIIHFSLAGSNNDTFNAQSSTEGRVGLMAYSQNPVLKDFLFVSVAEAIEPRLPMNVLSVGDVVCFSCGVKSMENNYGEWSSTPEDLLYLDAESGVAWALLPGTVKIEYSVPGIGKVTSLDLNVRNVNRIGFYGAANADDIVITNEDKGSHFDFPVRLGDAFENVKGNCDAKSFPTDSVPIPFECSLSFDKPSEILDIEDVFSVSGVFLLGKVHNYACRVKPIQVPKLQLHASLIRSNLHLTVKLSSFERYSRDFAGEPKIISSQPLPLRFQPSFYLHSDVLELTNKHPEGMIYVTGGSELLSQLKLIPSDSSFLEIDKYGVKQEASANGIVSTHDQILDKFPEGTESRGFRIRVLPYFWSMGDFTKNLSVSLISQSSKQFVDISVKVRITAPLAGESYSSGYIRDFLASVLGLGYFWILIPTTTILTLAAVHLLWKYNETSKSSVTSSSADYIFVTRPSPRCSTPLEGLHSRLSDSDSPAAGRRLYSTDSPFTPYRFRTGSSSSNSMTQ